MFTYDLIVTDSSGNHLGTTLKMHLTDAEATIIAFLQGCHMPDVSDYADYLTITGTDGSTMTVKVSALKETGLNVRKEVLKIRRLQCLKRAVTIESIPHAYFRGSSNG